jgi:uncharacterized protein (TIGR02001 family)
VRAAALAFAFALVLPAAAQAQWSGSVGVDSDYRFRGVPLGGSKPTLRASANYDAPGGWYGGASATQARIVAGDRYTQLLGYAGYVRPLGAGALDLGLTGWWFVAEHRYDFAEAYAALLFDPVSLRLNYSPRYFGWPVQTAYVDASAQIPLAGGLRLLAHAGALVPLTRLDVPFFPDANRTRGDLRAGVGWALRELDLSLTWASVTHGGPPPASTAARRSGWAVAGTWYF